MRRLTLAYLKTESGSGLVLALAAVAALGVANSGYGGDYARLLNAAVPVQAGGFAETLSVAGWVRALLMAIFFLVLTMELKFELLRGELSNPRRLGLPALAAVGGFAAPVALTLVLGGGATAGWAVGAPTDGAAALAALALAGPRLAPSLRVLVMGVALADNLAAVVLTALLRDGPVDVAMTAGAGATLAGLALLSRWRRAPFLFYAIGFALVWGLTLKSGLGTALAGVACALTVPVGARRPGQESMLRFFMDSLHPYVAFGVLPLFVFSVAGVPLRELRPADLLQPGPLAVLAALAIGKPAGVFGACAAAILSRLVRRPTGAGWAELAGVALICGAGFTVSFYVAGPAAQTGAAGAALRAAVLLGSVAPALAGGGLLAWVQSERVQGGERQPVLG
jgi:NhaA family Na+:H+ antiporter